MQHYEVLEAMFPGIKAASMFESSPRIADSRDATVDLLDAVEDGREGTAPTPAAWAQRPLPTAPPAAPQLPVQRIPEGQKPAHADVIALSLQVLGKRMRLPEDEVTQLGLLTGQLIDLDLECLIDIDAEGWATVTYRFVLLNPTEAPIKRLLRDQWFENTSGVRIEPHESSDRRVAIQRLHDIGNLVKFACVFSPPIEPGEVGTISYTSSSGAVPARPLLAADDVEARPPLHASRPSSRRGDADLLQRSGRPARRHAGLRRRRCVLQRREGWGTDDGNA